MTIQNTTIRKAGPSQGNGVTTVFPFTFKVFTTADILVTYLDTLAVESVLVLTTNYTVSLNADQNTSPGGSVTLLVAPATATYITLTSQVTNTQNLSLTNSGGFYPSSINDALDRTVIQIQQLAEIVSRSAVVSLSGIGAQNPASLVFGINALGMPILSVLANIALTAVSSFMGSLLGLTTPAAVQTALSVPSVANLAAEAATRAAADSALQLQMQSISASVAASSLTATLSPTSLTFRNATLSNGAPVSATIASAISVIVPSTVTLATYSAQQSRIVLIALYNGGTPVLGVTSTVGGENLDETTLMTTTAIGTTCAFTGVIAVTTGILTLSATGTGTLALGMSITGTGVPSGTYVKALLTGTLGAAGSTYSTNIITAVASTALIGSAGTGVYTTAAVTASPFRVVGYIESTQATAGTWATAPSTIQGVGGQALAAMSSLGYWQTWQNVLASRALGTTYYNTTGKPITVSGSNTNISGGRQSITVNGIIIGYYFAASGAYDMPFNFIVPAGGSYAVSVTAGTTILNIWAELR